MEDTLTRPFESLHDAEQHIVRLEWQKHYLLRACAAIMVSENRRRDAAKKRGEVFRRSRAGRLACEAFDALTVDNPPDLHRLRAGFATAIPATEEPRR